MADEAARSRGGSDHGEARFDEDLCAHEIRRLLGDVRIEEPADGVADAQFHLVEYVHARVDRVLLEGAGLGSGVEDLVAGGVESVDHAAEISAGQAQLATGGHFAQGSRVAAETGGVDVGQAQGGGFARGGGEIEDHRLGGSVEQSPPAVGRGAADAVDGLDCGIDLDLLGLHLGIAEHAAGGFHDVAADGVEQTAHLRHAGVGHMNDPYGPRRILVGSLEGGQFRSERFDRDQAGRIVGRAIDPLERGKAQGTLIQHRIGSSERVKRRQTAAGEERAGSHRTGLHLGGFKGAGIIGVEAYEGLN